MKKVLIIGCGFAGFFASQQFQRFKREIELTVIDRKEAFDFLPLLPDIIGRGIDPELLSYPIRLLSERLGFNFINEEVRAVDVQKNIVSTATKDLDYDYLLIASGSETNFYGNEQIKKYAYKLDSVLDAKILFSALEKDNFDSLIIAGAGYTGVEIATNLRAYFQRRAIKKQIIIVERAPSVLGPLPEWMKTYVHNNLKELGIEVILNTVVDKIEGPSISLSCGKFFANALPLWVAGVRTADFLQGLNVEKNPQGRIKVDEYLRLKDNCFILGDCAYVAHKDGFLRMAVQFAIYQSISAVSNIIRSIKGLKLRKYRPVDLGYIIPMANNKSCGRVMGVKVGGMTATLMHFIMCVYRSVGLRNKSGIIKGLLKGGAR